VHMDYDRHDRQAIKKLPYWPQKLFEVIEKEEKGEIRDVPGLCKALMQLPPVFVFFSCLSGDGKREESGQDLGVLFTTSLRQKMEQFTALLSNTGFRPTTLIIIDDTEPVRFWNWNILQEEVTTWCRMIVKETNIPNYWCISLWSDLEKIRETNLYVDGTFASSYEEYRRIRGDKVVRSVAYHKLLQHIKQYPNKGLKTLSAQEATINKLVQYEFQGEILKKVVPNAILVQTETPWEVKDLLFHNQLRKSVASIIHPFERRR